MKTKFIVLGLLLAISSLHAQEKGQFVLVASDGVALREGRYRQGDEQTEDDKFGFHNYLDLNYLLSEVKIVRIADENSGFDALTLFLRRRDVKVHFVGVDIDELHTKAEVGMSERTTASHGGIKALA